MFLNSSVIPAIIAMSLTLVWVLLNSTGQAFFDIADSHLHRIKSDHVRESQSHSL